MEQFDPLFFSIFQHYKTKYKSKANTIALIYIILLQASLLFALGLFFMLFFQQMHVDVLSVPKAWSLFVIATIILLFRNWFYYTGKKRKVLNAKSIKNKNHTTNIWLLWLMPLGCILLAVIILQGF